MYLKAPSGKYRRGLFSTLTGYEPLALLALNIVSSLNLIVDIHHTATILIYFDLINIGSRALPYLGTHANERWKSGLTVFGHARELGSRASL